VAAHVEGMLVADFSLDDADAIMASLPKHLSPSSRRHVAQLIRINDRGPFIDDRELDVSYVVACRLGILDNGVSRMRVELLEVPKHRE